MEIKRDFLMLFLVFFFCLIALFAMNGIVAVTQRKKTREAQLRQTRNLAAAMTLLESYRRYILRRQKCDAVSAGGAFAIGGDGSRRMRSPNVYELILTA